MTHFQTSDQILRIIFVFLLATSSLPLNAPYANADNHVDGSSPSGDVSGAHTGSECIQDTGVSQTGKAAGGSELASGSASDDSADDTFLASELGGPSGQSVNSGSSQTQPSGSYVNDASAQSAASVIDSELVSELDKSMRSFEKAHEAYTQENEALLKMQDERAVLSGNIEKFRSEAERAQVVVDAAHDELESFEGNGFKRYIMRILQPCDYEEQVFLLRTLIDDRSDVIVSSNAAKSGLERKKEELDEQMITQGELRRIALENVNSRACEIEICCSKLHQEIKDASSTASEDNAMIKGAQQGGAAASVSNEVHIVEAESMLMRWYNETNALSGSRGALSFGEGGDFSMSQAFFVEKWGTAIDAYFEACDTEPGFSPLKGLGKTMAASAYKYHIDPRLCAAVSMAESSGGRYCIKPHNAWGWGAVDSDPYGGALSWNSWEEAIEAWHKGMAESKTGLANARTVSVLATIYCSSPIWGATVAKVMNDISIRTLPEQTAG